MSATPIYTPRWYWGAGAIITRSFSHKTQLGLVCLPGIRSKAIPIPKWFLLKDFSLSLQILVDLCIARCGCIRIHWLEEIYALEFSSRGFKFNSFCLICILSFQSWANSLKGLTSFCTYKSHDTFYLFHNIFTESNERHLICWRWRHRALVILFPNSLSCSRLQQLVFWPILLTAFTEKRKMLKEMKLGDFFLIC